jgi:hypothetical protein
MSSYQVQNFGCKLLYKTHDHNKKKTVVKVDSIFDDHKQYSTVVLKKHFDNIDPKECIKENKKIVNDFKPYFLNDHQFYPSISYDYEPLNINKHSCYFIRRPANSSANDVKIRFDIKDGKIDNDYNAMSHGFEINNNGNCYQYKLKYIDKEIKDVIANNENFSEFDDVCISFSLWRYLCNQILEVCKKDIFGDGPTFTFDDAIKQIKSKLIDDPHFVDSMKVLETYRVATLETDQCLLSVYATKYAGKYDFNSRMDSETNVAIGKNRDKFIKCFRIYYDICIENKQTGERILRIKNFERSVYQIRGSILGKFSKTIKVLTPLCDLKDKHPIVGYKMDPVQYIGGVAQTDLRIYHPSIQNMMRNWFDQFVDNERKAKLPNSDVISCFNKDNFKMLFTGITTMDKRMIDNYYEEYTTPEVI